MSKGLIYLACPYSHPNRIIRRQRFREVSRAAAQFMKEGHFIFSPISHTHPIAEYGLPLGWEFWKEYDEAMLKVCKELWVLMLPGWNESRGVTAEIKIAEELRLQILYVEAQPIPSANRSNCEPNDE